MKTKKIYYRNKHKKTNKDFYTMVNEQWIKKHQKETKKYPFIDSFFILHEKVKKEINEIIENLIHSNKEINNLYLSFMNPNDILIESYIFNFIEELSSLQKDKNNSLYNLINFGLKKGINQLITINIASDQINTTENICYITESGINIADSQFYIHNNKKEIYRYKQFLESLFSCIFGENNSFDVNKVIEIEKYMSKYLYSPLEPKTNEKIYNVFNEISSKSKLNFDWNKFSSLLGFQKTPKNVVVENPTYMKEFIMLLKNKWNSNDIFVYYISNILFLASKFHTKLHQIVLNYYIINKKIKKNSHKEKAYNFIKDVFNTLVNKEYLKKYENKREIQLTKIIVHKIMLTFIERLKHNKWLSSDSIQKALLKCNNMKVTIGNKKKWMDDPNIKFSNYDIMGNYENIISWKLNHLIKNYYKLIPVKDTWLKGIDMNTYEINAEYNMNKNEIIIPNAILQPPFVNVKKSFSYNMATIGVLIGHELSHAFDNQGSLFDDKGSYKRWWKKEDYDKYSDIQNKIKNFILNMANEDHYKVNPSLTIGENIADISGFQIVEETFINDLIERKIYGTEQEKYLKEFYVDYARLWKAVINPKMMKKLYKIDSHSLAKYRVNSSLAFSHANNNI
jgi:putative endopeptidase